MKKAEVKAKAKGKSETQGGESPSQSGFFTSHLKKGSGIHFCLLPFALAFTWFSLVSSKPAPKEPFMAVARQVTGSARMQGKDSAVVSDVKLGDIIPGSRTLSTGDNGLLVLRFHPDFARIEARVKTRYLMAYARTDSTKPRRIKLEQGQLVLGVPKRSPPLQAEDTHSQARADNARFSFVSDPNSASTFIILDGTVTVHNRSKDVTAVVRRGQKAVSDVNGLRISDASDAELEQVGLRQNMLEVDFWNPETEEFSTLEVEYESNF